MSRPIDSYKQMQAASHGEVILREAFDYTALPAEVAGQVQTAAQRIRQTLKQSLKTLIAIGNELLAVKAALPHGSFGPWLRAEFGWAERTARNFMTVALGFKGKSATIADLPIDSTAAYLLSAASAPEGVIEEAVKRAERGQQITGSVAREIIRTARKKTRRQSRRQSTPLPGRKLLGQLLEALESFRQQWHPQQVSTLARELRDFANSLECN